MPGIFGDYRFENGRMGHLPKYWNAEEERVFVWQPNLSTEYPLERIVGTYTFVALFNEGKPDNLFYRGAEPGFLKIRVRPGTKCAPENVLGVFEVGDSGWRGGTFSGLLRENNSEGPPRPTLHRFNLTTSLKNFIPLKGHALEVLDAVDDNGNNYINIRLEYFDQKSNCISYMAKKELDGGQRTALTKAERRRLGIAIKFQEVEFYGRNPGLRPPMTTGEVALSAIVGFLSTWWVTIAIILYVLGRELLDSPGQ